MHIHCVLTVVIAGFSSPAGVTDAAGGRLRVTVPVLADTFSEDIAQCSHELITALGYASEECR